MQPKPSTLDCPLCGRAKLQGAVRTRWSELGTECSRVDGVLNPQMETGQMETQLRRKATLEGVPALSPL